jgi:hypothetical protein
LHCNKKETKQNNNSNTYKLSSPWRQHVAKKKTKKKTKGGFLSSSYSSFLKILIRVLSSFSSHPSSSTNSK